MESRRGRTKCGNRIFAAPISNFLYSLFSIFCLLAGVDELNLEGGNQGIWTEDFCLLVKFDKQRVFHGSSVLA